jgi:hypothetical protein
VEVDGPLSDLHSGLEGGVSHEPLQDLCALLGSLVDGATGCISVPGIYDGVAPIAASELHLYRGLDFDAQTYVSSHGLPGVYSSSNVPVAVEQQHDAIATTNEAQKAAGRKRGRTLDASKLEESSIVEPLKHADDSTVSQESSDAVVCSSVSVTRAAGTLSDTELSVTILLRRWREPAVTVHGISCSAANDSIIPRQAVGYVSVRTVSYHHHVLHAGCSVAHYSHCYAPSV